MKQYKIILLVAFLLLVSCKNENKKPKKATIVQAAFSFDFPDTLYLNEGYDGKIKYRSHLDTITTHLNKLKKFRSLVYTFLKTNEINYSDEHLKKIVNDTFYTASNRIIPLYVKFDKLGVNYIDGIITDQVMIENGAKNEKGEPMTRIITNEFRATKKIIVIVNPNVRR